MSKPEIITTIELLHDINSLKEDIERALEEENLPLAEELERQLIYKQGLFDKQFEKKEPEIKIKPEDIRIDVFRPRTTGMHVQCLPNYVKIEHIPSGIVVTKCEMSQLRAKKECLAEIERLLEVW